MTKSKYTHTFTIILYCASALVACGPQKKAEQAKPAITVSDETRQSRALVGTKIVLNTASFYTFLHLDPATRCAGNIKTYYHPFEMTDGLPTPLPKSQYDTSVSIRPNFIKNVSVDLTDAGTLPSDNVTTDTLSCLLENKLTTSTSALCASFSSSAPSSGYYGFDDTQCINVGLIKSSNPLISRLRAGGMYIDIDRDELGKNPNLLLNLTYQTQSASNQNAILRIHLSQTNESAEQLRRAFQPRHLYYNNDLMYPTAAFSMVVLPPTHGETRTEQYLVPLASHPHADRIRIERYLGSATLLSAAVFRMGQ